MFSGHGGTQMGRGGGSGGRGGGGGDGVLPGDPQWILWFVVPQTGEPRYPM